MPRILTVQNSLIRQVIFLMPRRRAAACRALCNDASANNN